MKDPISTFSIDLGCEPINRWKEIVQFYYENDLTRKENPNQKHILEEYGEFIDSETEKILGVSKNFVLNQLTKLYKPTKKTVDQISYFPSQLKRWWKGNQSQQEIENTQQKKIEDEKLEACRQEIFEELYGISLELRNLFGREIKGLSFGHLIILNLGYDFMAHCTSSVVLLPDQNDPNEKTAVHLRNMDWDMDIFRKLTLQIQWNISSNSSFVTVGYLFHSVVFTGIRLSPPETSLPTPYVKSQESFSVSLNYRKISTSFISLLPNVILSFFESHGASTILRYVIQYSPSFSYSVSTLSSVSIPSPVYYILCGEKVNDGVIITRDRLSLSSIQKISDWKEFFPESLPLNPSDPNSMPLSQLQLSSIEYEIPNSIVCTNIDIVGKGYEEWQSGNWCYDEDGFPDPLLWDVNDSNLSMGPKYRRHSTFVKLYELYNNINVIEQQRQQQFDKDVLDHEHDLIITDSEKEMNKIRFSLSNENGERENQIEMLFERILFQKPIFNIQTIYSSIFIPKYNYHKSYLHQ